MEQLTKKEYYTLTSDEIDKLAETHYGIPDFCWVATQEVHNGYTVITNVTAADIKDHDEDKEKELRAGKAPMYSGYILLPMLVKDGHIPAGNYIIDHSW